MVGFIRIGSDDSKTLVVMKEKLKSRTFVVHVASQIPGTDIRIVKVEKDTVHVRNEEGAMEHLAADPEEAPPVEENRFVGTLLDEMDEINSEENREVPIKWPGEGMKLRDEETSAAKTDPTQRNRSVWD